MDERIDANENGGEAAGFAAHSPRSRLTSEKARCNSAREKLRSNDLLMETERESIARVRLKIAAERQAIAPIREEKKRLLEQLWRLHCERFLAEVFDLHDIRGEHRLGQDAAAAALVDACSHDAALLAADAAETRHGVDGVAGEGGAKEGKEEGQLTHDEMRRRSKFEAAMAVISDAEASLGELPPFSLRSFVSIWKHAGGRLPRRAPSDDASADAAEAKSAPPPESYVI
jgi:hypothetical protein